MSERRDGRRPGRVWLKWVIAVLGIGVAVGFILPLLQQTHRSREPYSRCGANLRQIALASSCYADDYDQRMPSSLEALVPDYIANPRLLKCLSGTDARSSDYILVPGLDAGIPGDFILVYDKSLANHCGTGRNVAVLDGHVEWWPAAREAEFRKRLAEQAEAVRRWRQARTTR